MIDLDKLNGIKKVLVDARRFTKVPFNDEPRNLEYISKYTCPIIAFLPHMDSKGRVFQGIVGARANYDSSRTKVLYTYEKSDWWNSLSLSSKDEYYKELIEWVKLQNTPLYKYVSVIDGKLYSTFINNIQSHALKYCKVIKYTPNIIINSPIDSAGIFLSSELANDFHTAEGLSSAMIAKRLDVYSVNPLAEVKVFRDDRVGFGCITCNCVQLVKRVGSFYQN